MRFFVDGRVDIRPLGNQDKPFIGLPYDTIAYQKVGSDIDNDDVKTVTLTKSDWGANDNWVTYILTLAIYNATIFGQETHQGFELLLGNGGNDIAFTQTFPAELYPPILYGGIYQIYVPVFIPSGYYTDNAQTLAAQVFNALGSTVSWHAFFCGVPT